MRSAFTTLRPALHFVKFPVALSNATSAPRAIAFDPTTVARLTTGFAVKFIPVLTAA